MAKRPAPSAIPSSPDETNPFEALTGSASPESGEGAGDIPQELPASELPPQSPADEPPPADEPLVGVIVEQKPLFAVPAAFSDDPPEGWGLGEGNVLSDPDPVTSQLDPVASARASLLEDAARARGAQPPPPPRPAVAVKAVTGNRAPEIRQALARAAAHPSAIQYRSRIAIGAAWQYDGKLALAPDWVDREWLAYDDGPALNVPSVGIVRNGQWIVMQLVHDDRGGVAHTELKVYDNDVFTNLFMPVAPLLENPDAEQKPEAGPPDGSRGARPESSKAA